MAKLFIVWWITPAWAFYYHPPLYSIVIRLCLFSCSFTLYSSITRSSVVSFLFPCQETKYFLVSFDELITQFCKQPLLNEIFSVLSSLTIVFLLSSVWANEVANYYGTFQVTGRLHFKLLLILSARTQHIKLCCNCIQFTLITLCFMCFP